MSRIYVASSWRNEYQPAIVELLRMNGHQVYDFRNPPDRTGFAWRQVNNGEEIKTFEQYRAALQNPIAAAGFLSDFRAMEWADTCVLVLPCGRSAHLEAGWFSGRGKRVVILTGDGEEPELMALMATHIVDDPQDVVRVLAA
jgi:hypothetical protein